MRVPKLPFKSGLGQKQALCVSPLPVLDLSKVDLYYILRWLIPWLRDVEKKLISFEMNGKTPNSHYLGVVFEDVLIRGAQTSDFTPGFVSTAF